MAATIHSWSKTIIALVATMLLIAWSWSCGGSTTSDAPTDAGVDGAGDDGSTFDGISGDVPGGDGACGDTKSDPKNCGGCGNACATGQLCAGGKCVCPLYQKFCGGKCIGTSVDPDNCGDCGKKCAADQACSAGVCVPVSSGCIPAPTGGDRGLIPCDRACVDPLNDNKNCGACGHACATGTGCVNGVCVPVIPLGPAPSKCADGLGPPVKVDKDCTGKVGATTFRWALCSCGDVALTASLLTDAYDSTKGPYPPSPKEVGGGVGINGGYSGPVSNSVDIGGALWSSAASGVATRSPSTVRQEGHFAGPLSSSVDPLSILDDTYAAANVTTTSSIAISKTLYVSPGATVGSGVTAAATVTKPVTVPPPCDCGASRIAVDKFIAAAAAKNDDATIGLDPALLATPSASGASARLDLPCGIYYLTKIDKPGSSVTIFAHGRTGVFIDGDVVGQVVSFVLDPTAELDVFVKGNVTTGGELVIGSPNFPALSRTYVGGSATLTLSGEAGRLGGNLYAAYAQVDVTSHLILYGALYANGFTNSEAAEIHYDRAVLEVGKDCPPPVGPPPGCTSCKDCDNQACIAGACGKCGSSSDCCPPLTCIGGACKLVPK